MMLFVRHTHPRQPRGPAVSETVRGDERRETRAGQVQDSVPPAPSRAAREMALGDSEKLAVLCMVLHWHRRTFVRLGCAALRRFVLRRVFGWWLRTAARVQDEQFIRRLEA